MQDRLEAAQPGDAGMLPVGGGHRLHYELSGHPAGMPVLCLHGGPGSGCGPRLRTLYDGARHRIVFHDQRGAGRSMPAGRLRHNRTPDLIADIERLRRHLRIERWLVTGGSWGASLAVAYAAVHPAAVSGLLLRAPFLTGDADLDWFFGEARALAPEAWAALHRAWRGGRTADKIAGRDVPAALGRALRDPRRAPAVAHAWRCYEGALGSPDAAPPAMAADPGDSGDPTDPADPVAQAALIAKYRLQAAYLARRCDLGEPALLAAARALRGVPCLVLHGRRDRVCRPDNAVRLAQAIGTARVVWIDEAGHDPFHPATRAAFVAAQRGFDPRHGFDCLDAPS